MRPASRIAAVVLLAAGIWACGAGGKSGETAPPPKRFPAPIFDGLSLGMTRAAVQKVHAIRSSLTASGRNRRVWIYSKPGEYSAELTFDETNAAGDLVRIDVHFGRSDATPDQFIARFSRTLGEPEVKRRKATINAYGDQRHDQYDTIWSDATQYVFLTERQPAEGAKGTPVYFLTVKQKEITATGPPTGYVPPPPPEDEDGKTEEPIF